MDRHDGNGDAAGNRGCQLGIHLSASLFNSAFATPSLSRCAYSGLHCGQTLASPKSIASSEAINRFEFGQALKLLWGQIAEVNLDIERVRPWESLKAGDADLVNPKIQEWCWKLTGIAQWLQPFLPTASKRILQLLSTTRIARVKALFPRIN